MVLLCARPMYEVELDVTEENLVMQPLKSSEEIACKETVI
jgi:hypothetical protein